MAFRSTTSRVLVWVLITLTTAGCSSWRPSPLGPIQANAAAIQPDPLKLRLVDNQTITLHDWTLEGDTLRGSRESWEKDSKVMKREAIALSMVDYREGRADDEVLPEYLAAKQEELATARLRAAVPPPPMEFPGVTRFRLVNGSTIELENAAVDGDSLRGRVPVTLSDTSHRLMILARKDVLPIESKEADFPGVTRFRLVNGSTMELENAIVDGDSLRGRAPVTASDTSHRFVIIARKDVLHVETKEADTGKTVGLVVLIAAVVLGALALAMSSVNWDSY